MKKVFVIWKYISKETNLRMKGMQSKSFLWSNSRKSHLYCMFLRKQLLLTNFRKMLPVGLRFNYSCIKVKKTKSGFTEVWDIGRFIQSANHTTNHNSDWVYQKNLNESLYIQSFSSVEFLYLLIFFECFPVGSIKCLNRRYVFQGNVPFL